MSQLGAVVAPVEPVVGPGTVGLPGFGRAAARIPDRPTGGRPRARSWSKWSALYTGIATTVVERAGAALSQGRADQAEVLAAEVRHASLRDRWLNRSMSTRAYRANSMPPSASRAGFDSLN